MNTANLGEIMIKLYSFLYMLYHEPFLVLTMLQSGAKWHKWPRWKFLYCEARKIKCGIVLEIGGGLSTLVLSKALKSNGGKVRTVEGDLFWRQFIQYRLLWDNVDFLDAPNFIGIDLVFIDNDYKLPNPSWYRVIVDNRQRLCEKMGLRFIPKLKVGVNF